MKKRSILRNVLCFGSAASLGYLGLKAFLGLRPGADENFFGWTGPTSQELTVGTETIRVPVMYYRDDTFMGVFSAAYEPIQALLPSKDLHAIRLPNGRAAVSIIAFNYLETSIGPYGEIGIVIHCTHQRQAPPLLPLLLESRFPQWGVFVLHLPVTTTFAREGGRRYWGYPKFVAHMEFQKCPAFQKVSLHESGQHILTLSVKQRGWVIKDNRPMVSYSVLNDHLHKTVIPCRSIYQLGLTPGLARLKLGNHEIAKQLQSLDLSTMSLLTKNYLTRSAILPLGKDVGQVDFPYSGYTGGE